MPVYTIQLRGNVGEGIADDYSITGPFETWHAAEAWSQSPKFNCEDDARWWVTKMPADVTTRPPTLRAPDTTGTPTGTPGLYLIDFQLAKPVFTGPFASGAEASAWCAAHSRTMHYQTMGIMMTEAMLRSPPPLYSPIDCGLVGTAA